MKNKKTKSSLLSGLIVMAAAAACFAVSLFSETPSVANAQGASGNVAGFAWSANTGWISFNCTNTSTCGTISYGVNVDVTTGSTTGYAWSSNVGWISFNPSDLAGCPSGTCAAKLQSVSATNQKGDKPLTGWAKAVLGGTAGTAGWDGWIRLDHTQNNAVSYNFKTQQFTGWAWGSDVIGWISFNSQNQGTSPIYAVTGPAPTIPIDDVYALGGIATSSKCDASNASYLEVSAPVNGNVGPDFTYSGYSVTSAGTVSALPTGSLYDASSRIVFKHFVSTTSPSYRYAIYARRTSTGESTSTATSTLTGLKSTFTCDTNMPVDPASFKFTSKSFILNPDTVNVGDQCVAFMSFTHDGVIDSQVSVNCTLTSPPAAPIDLGYQLTSTRNVNPGLHTYSCTLASSTNPSTIYNTFSISRRCYKSTDVKEI